MSTHEVAIGLDFLISTCEADATLMSAVPGGFHRGAADVGTNMPFGIIGYQAGSDALTMNGVRVMNNSLFQAKIVGPANQTAAVTSAASLLDDILRIDRNVDATGGTILCCYREQPLQYDENLPTGEKRTHFGGLYRLIIRQS